MKEMNKEQVDCASREDGLSGICSPWTRAQKAECLTVTEMDIREYLRRKRERMWNE
jgi:hypothetical protein